MSKLHLETIVPEYLRKLTIYLIKCIKRIKYNASVAKSDLIRKKQENFRSILPLN
jgi:hypothetical protein